MKKLFLASVLMSISLIFSSCETKQPQLENIHIQESTQKQEIALNNQQEDALLRKDTKNVFYNNKILEGADPESFESIPYGDSDFLFYKDKNALYISSGPYSGNTYLTRFKMKNTTPIHLSHDTSIDLSYVKDNDSVYYLDSTQGEAIKMTEADIKTFTKVSDSSIYMKDKNYIFYNGKIIKGADVNSFMTSGNNITYKDNNHVYYYGNIVKDADPRTFTFIENSSNKSAIYFKDKNSVYFNPSYGSYNEKTEIKKIPDMIPKSFEVIKMSDTYSVCQKDDYIKDSQHVYVGPIKGDFLVLKDIHPNTFQYLGCGSAASANYIKDSNSVYYIYSGEKIQKIENADPKTFRPLDNYLSEDKNYIYEEGIIKSKK